MSQVALVALTVVLMEPVVYLAHRFVMHRRGIVLHQSHHDSTEDRFELNDLYPLGFSVVAMLLSAVAFNVPGWAGLVPVVVGMALYGAAYLFVHDVYIHQRLPWRWEVPVLERLKAAHRLHHLYGGEPYGMLFPVVPRRVRQRAASATYDPFARVG